MNAPAVRAVAPVTSMQLQTDIGGLSIQPQNFGEVISFAEHMAKSTFVPAHLRGKREGDWAALRIPSGSALLSIEMVLTLRARHKLPVTGYANSL